MINWRAFRITARRAVHGSTFGVKPELALCEPVTHFKNTAKANADGEFIKQAVISPLHKIFRKWILGNVDYWNENGIIVEKVVNRIDNPPVPDYPYVCVIHNSPYAMGQIDLHSVHEGYIANFEAIRIVDEKHLIYHQEFSGNPDFDSWQKTYIDFLCSK